MKRIVAFLLLAILLLALGALSVGAVTDTGVLAKKPQDAFSGGEKFLMFLGGLACIALPAGVICFFLIKLFSRSKKEAEKKPEAKQTKKDAVPKK